MVFILLIIYDTAIATLALTHMTPPSNLTCHLEQQWGRLFSSKNAEVVRRIQDRHQCCGLHSLVDKAWPFADRSHPVTACRDAFNRQNSCFGGWRRDEQITAGLLLLVAVMVFLMKVSRITPDAGPWLARGCQENSEVPLFRSREHLARSAESLVFLGIIPRNHPFGTQQPILHAITICDCNCQRQLRETLVRIFLLPATPGLRLERL